ncbi:hypothetical protein [Rossellomorea marisflavi]|uniref:hypothetical protein n=1 Tax=Rossellomorea marisflavi TaxID=189381 RepID=UPI003457807A
MKKKYIIGGVMVVPLIISLLLEVPIFSFAKGNVESWIAFWGSYIGALIGAGTVYLVTNLQVKAQRKLQIHAIKAEHENALNREIKQFHFKNEIEKIEEFFDLLEDVLDSVSKCVNDFTKYVTYTHILYSGHDEYTDDEGEKLKEEIKILHVEAYNWIHLFTKMILKADRLSVYIENAEMPSRELCIQLQEMVDEIREGYGSKQSYRKYPDPNKPPLEHHLHALSQRLMHLNANVLKPKLNEKILEMKNSTY